MSVRYYVSDIVQVTGSLGTPEYRAQVEQITVPGTGFLAFETNRVLSLNPDGTPKLPWSMVVASGTRHDLARNVAGIDPFPAIDLDIRFDAADEALKTTLGEQLQARSIDTSFVSNATTLRQVIQRLGELHLGSAFNAANFDVPG